MYETSIETLCVRACVRVCISVCASESEREFVIGSSASQKVVMKR